MYPDPRVRLSELQGSNYWLMKVEEKFNTQRCKYTPKEQLHKPNIRRNGCKTNDQATT